MDDFVLFIIGKWECSEKGEWKFKTTQGQVGKTVRLNSVSSYENLREKIVSAFGFDSKTQNVSFSYWSAHISNVCTQTNLPPFAIESDDDVSLFLRFCAVNEGLNLLVTLHKTCSQGHWEITGERDLRDIVLCEEDDVDDESLIALTEYVEKEYNKRSLAVANDQRRNGKRPLDVHDELVAAGSSSKKQSHGILENIVDRGEPSSPCSSEDTQPNTLLDEMADLIEHELLQGNRKEQGHLLSIEPVGFSLGIDDVSDTNPVADCDGNGEVLTDDHPQIDNVNGNYRDDSTEEPVMRCDSPNHTHY